MALILPNNLNLIVGVPTPHPTLLLKNYRILYGVPTQFENLTRCPNFECAVSPHKILKPQFSLAQLLSLSVALPAQLQFSFQKVLEFCPYCFGICFVIIQIWSRFTVVLGGGVQWGCGVCNVMILSKPTAYKVDFSFIEFRFGFFHRLVKIAYHPWVGG